MNWQVALLMRVAATTVVLCLFNGCSRSPYELAPVEGVVTIDNQPMTGAKVMFAPVARGENRNSGKPAFGVLSTDGTFKLTTYREDDGAVVGDHWVTIIRVEPNGHNGATTGSNPTNATFNRLSVPTKVNVQAGQQNHVSIKLTAVDVKRFGRFDD
jgi:hypothetical protein